MLGFALAQSAVLNIFVQRWSSLVWFCSGLIFTLKSHFRKQENWISTYAPHDFILRWPCADDRMLKSNYYHPLTAYELKNFFFKSQVGRCWQSMSIRPGHLTTVFHSISHRAGSPCHVWWIIQAESSLWALHVLVWSCWRHIFEHFMPLIHGHACVSSQPSSLIWLRQGPQAVLFPQTPSLPLRTQCDWLL